MPQLRMTVIFPAVMFAVVGALLSALLFVQHGQAAPADCGAAVCADVLASRWATFPPQSSGSEVSTGVPVALWGVVYFSALALWLLVVGKPGWAQRHWHSFPTAVALLGGLVSLALIVGMFSLNAWCPLCLAVHLMNFALIPFVFLCRPEKGPEDADAPVSLQPVLTAAALVLCGATAVWFAWDSHLQRQRTDKLLAALAAQAASASPSTAPTPATARHLAGVQTPVEWVLDSSASDPDTVVVYTDLLCAHCRVFEERLFDVLAPKFRGNLRVAVKHFPLCAQCNPGSTDVHPWACEAAYLAEAARAFGGPAAFLNALREIDPKRTEPWTDEDAISLAIDLGLSPEPFLEHWQSDAVRARVARDIAEARRQGVTQTPAVFVNGTRIDSKTRDLSVFWDQLAARPRSTGPSETPVVTASAAVRTAKPVLPAETPAATPMPDRRARAAALILSMHDRNNDGVLQKEEWSKLYDDGTKIDTDHDEVITRDEIFAGIRDVQGGPSGTLPATAPSKAAKPVAETPRISTIYEGDALDISGPTLDGSTFDLRDQRGKTVLVAFWTTWCTHCVDETADLVRLYRRYHDLGLEIVGVNGDVSTDAAREFVEQNQIPWPQIHFSEGEDRGQKNPIARRYNVRAYPALFLVDKDSVVSGVHLRGDALETQIAASLGVQAAPDDAAQSERTEIAAALVRPSNTPRESAFAVQLGDRLQIAGPTVDGGSFDVANHRGKPVLVAFWATWCPHCKHELPVIRDVYDRYRDKGLTVVTISADRKKDDLDKYLAQNPLPWPTIYFDREGLRGFNSPLTFWHGVRNIPALYLLDGEGRVASVKPRGGDIEREVAKAFGVAPASPAPRAPVASAAATAAQPVASAPSPATGGLSPSARSTLENTSPQKLAQTIIQRYDTNRDGSLQEAEYTKIRGDFSRYDANQDKLLTEAELAAGIALMQRLKPIVKPLATP